MLINSEKCAGCQSCVPYCPVSALETLENGTVTVNMDLCVECGVCLRAEVCDSDAIYQQELTWPRVLRSIFSNVKTLAPGTSLGGRGTEEMKTNDATNRFLPGFLGIGIEMGRPGVASRLSEAEKVTMAVAKMGIVFEKENPVYDLFADPSTGKMKDEVLSERVLSLVLEFVIPRQRLSEFISIIREVAPRLDTVFSLDLIVVAENDGSVDPTIAEELIGLGFPPAPNGKTNLGLGRKSN